MVGMVGKSLKVITILVRFYFSIRFYLFEVTTDGNSIQNTEQNQKTCFHVGKNQEDGTLKMKNCKSSIEIS